MIRKTFILILFLFSCENIFAQNNEVSIRDFEERLALLYWTRDFRSLTEQTEKFIRLDSTYAGRNHFRLGIAYLHLNQVEKAEEAFKKGMREDPVFPYNQAALALIRGNEDQQLTAFQETLVLSRKYNSKYYSDKRPEKMEWSLILPKSNAWVKHNIGVLHYEQKQYDSARYYFRKASSERPEDTEHLIALSISEYQAGRFSQAQKYIHKAGKLYEKDYRIAALNSLYQYKQGQYKAALLSVDDVKSKDAKNSLLLLLKEVYKTEVTKKNDLFDENISKIIAGASSFSFLEEILPGKTIEEKKKILVEEIEKKLLLMDFYYNGKIYSPGGYVPQTYDGKKNSEEKLYIKRKRQSTSL